MFVATYEHVIHVESFKNIDLFQQGLYYLKFYLSHNGQIAQPYNYFEGNSKKQQQWANQNEDVNAFQTKTFMIRFQEEEVEIDESCIFKIEVNATPQYECEFSIICELMCADIQKIGGPPSEELFKSASVFEAKIKNSHRGVHEYVPVMFDNHHFCVVNCTMHSILQDFKFRLSDLQVSLNQDNQQKRLKVSVQPKTFTEFLHRSTQRFTQTQQFFDYYVVQLKESCENLLQMVAKLCGSLKLNQELQKLPTIPKYSFIQYQESSVFNDKKNNQNLKIADVLNLQNIKDQHLLATLIENDINQYSSVLFELQNQLVQIIQKNSKQYRTILQKDYKMKLKDKLGETCFREIIKTDNFSIGTNCQKQHNEISNQIRKKPQLIESLIDVQDQILFQDNKCSTILFEEIYQRQPPVAASNQYHVLFLVHGFQGNSLDMRLIRNHIQLMHPNIHFYSSKSNEDQTDGDIGNMGFNLAQEVKQHIIESVKGQNYKISFLGHSLGGVIIRAALPHLQDLKLSMHSFISLSSPHLGYAYNNSALIDAGLWFLKQMRKSISLTQLAMSDSEQIENTFLFKLSKQQGLNWFQNILLVCSSQDQYVPFESARIQKCFECNDQNYKKYEKMVENLMQGLRANQIKRLNVNFQLQENRTLDNMIGRSAHIMFLENPQFLKMLSTCIEDIFN